jgi:hypothetical protein
LQQTQLAVLQQFALAKAQLSVSAADRWAQVLIGNGIVELAVELVFQVELQ